MAAPAGSAKTDAHPGLTVIVSTHSREILELYQYDAEEEDLRKGGYIIEEDD
jgi:hypothetical protein